MHITQITISGFKSYRDATVVGPFAAGHNVVVGRNGSGKSNFFDAVRFVLSDTYSSLRAEDRVALLHEGAGASVLSAYVEIVFDNSHGRLPFDRDEVALRRMIGLKKDEFLLDRKNVTRSEVFSTLETAGLSRSNPYYIVQQGKVAALCAMTDKQRLDLLQEVAGTRIYNSRRAESLKSMDESDAHRNKISEVIAYIDSRLGELESEKDELRAFQSLDKERKALKYTIHVREVEEAKAALEGLDGDNHQYRSRTEELQARLTDVRANIAGAEREIKSLAPELRRSEEELEAMDGQRKKAVDKVAEYKVLVTEAEQAAKTVAETVATSRSELNQVEQLIESKREELEPLETHFKTLQKAESKLRKKLTDSERRLLNLRVKEDRTNHFPNAQARDAHLRKLIREQKKRRDGCVAQIESAKKDIVRLEKAIEKGQSRKEEYEAQRQELLASANSGDPELVTLRAQRDRLHAERQEARRKESDLRAKARDLHNGMGRLEAAKRSVLGAGAYRAIQAVMRASHEDPRNLGPNRVYGPLVDLINVDSKFSSAADAIAGSTLTHIVVDNDATSARLVRIMKERRAGRVTFIPLNRLDDNQRRPPSTTADAIPLISKISCQDMFLPAIRQIFGRTLVTRTVEIGAEMSKRHGVDCVTLDGDVVNKRGAMHGGYMDASRSRIDAARFLREAQAELAALEPQKASWQAKEAEVDASLTRVLGEMQRRESTKRTSNSTAARLHTEIARLSKYIQNDKANIPRAKDRMAVAEESITAAEAAIEDHEKELGTPMVSGLSPEEEVLMECLKSELETLGLEVTAKSNERALAERSVVSLQSELSGNLERRAAALREAMNLGGQDSSMMMSDDNDSQAQTQNELRNKLEELNLAEADVNSVVKSIEESSAVVHDKRKRHNRLSNRLEHDREEESKISKELEDDRQMVERRYNQRSIERQKKSDAEKSIRELGSLPADFDKHRGLSMGVLMKKLKKTNQSLQKYSHVNKKALDQYLKFTEERDSLTRHLGELEEGAQSIRQLIESLDHRKDDDILRTYKGVSKFFSDVFRELVPGGKASLVMLKSGDNGQNDDGEEGEPRRIRYTGVAMKISFSTTGQAYLLQQLSGGQKSIVALALIFAIQRLDPAPFYLFDEIDANLDATHRQAVANLIRKRANLGTQFVTTTFRPEFVNAGDMWYGVTHKRKVSSVQQVNKNVALTFVTNDPGQS